MPTPGSQQGRAGHGATGFGTQRAFSPTPESVFPVLMLINPWRHKPHGTFHLLPHPFFTTPKWGN